MGRHRGQALMPVLFVVLILTAFAVTVTSTARKEVRASSNFMKEAQQEIIARGAIQYAMATLQQATNGGAAPPQLTPPPDTDSNGWTQLGDGWYKLEIIDTASRVNINVATPATLGKLPAFQQNPELVANLVNWRDSDENPTVQWSSGTNAAAQSISGAESDYYETLSPPYLSKNAPFNTVDELLLVKGFTPEILYGPPTSVAQNASVSPSGISGGLGLSRKAGSRQTPGQPGGAPVDSLAPAVDTSQSTVPLSELITTYSREANLAADGSQRVNIKTASENDLQQKLGLSPQQAQQIVRGRGQNGASLTSIADLMNTITYPGINRQIMQRIGDKITVTDSQYRDDVVNINTAPAEVLAAIPGVDATVYNAVINARQGGSTFTSLGDLFTLTSLNRQQLASLVDHVCTKSSVYLVRVRVRIPGSQRVYAAQALVELTPAQQPAQAGTTGAGAGAAAGAATPQPAKLLQWREAGRSPGYSSWSPPPNYFSTGGTVGNP